MGKIKYINVISDENRAYNGRVKVYDLINDYISGLDKNEDSDCIKWLKDKSYEVEPKLAFITSVWGIEYELIEN